MVYLDSAHFTLQDSQIVEGFSVVWRSSNGRLQHLQRVLSPALGGEDDGQVVEALREVRPQLQRALVAHKGP